MMENSIKELIQKEIEAIGNIPVDFSFELAVNKIKNKVHGISRCGKVVMSGMGKAGQIALNISTTLCSTGTPAVYLHPSEAQHGDLGILQENDVLILLSNSGKTREILELIELSKRMYPHISIICITGKKDSPLANKSDIVLHTGDAEEICPLGLTPTISTTLMTVIGDILVVELMKKIKFSKKEYAKRHHSGYLGQKSKEESNKLNISVGIISWNSPETLTKTLTSYSERGFLDNVNDVCILFNEVSEEDVNVAELFGIPYLPYKENLGIGKGFLELTKQAKTDNVLILENDWQLIEDLPTTLDRLQSGLALLNNGYDVIRYRHRTNPGYPHYSFRFRGAELEYYDDWHKILSPHLIDSLHWLDPSKEFPDKIQKDGEYFTTTSRYGNWTNNPCLYKKDFYLNTIEPFIDEWNLEQNIAYWWPRQSFKIAHGEGLFSHVDIAKYGTYSNLNDPWGHTKE
jgi:D-arabinose 5-phosphate isomerase GutQ